MTETMLAAVLPAAGAPLQLEEIAIPRPRRGEILVRVAACGVCHTDLHVIKGEVAFPTPAVLGHEISGTVVELGDGVGHVEVGERVVGTFIMPCGSCPACLSARDDLCGPFFSFNRLRGTLYDGETRLFRTDGSPLAMYSMGGLAEYAVLPATAAFPVPAAIPFEEASVLGCAALTAYGAVRHGADLRLGERVAVVGTGGVGSLVVQFAKALGAAAGGRGGHQRGEAAGGGGAGRDGSCRRLGRRPRGAGARAHGRRGRRRVRGAGPAGDVPATRSACWATAVAWWPSASRPPASSPGRDHAPRPSRAPYRRLVRRASAERTCRGCWRSSSKGCFVPRTPSRGASALEQADAAYQALDAREIVGRAIVTMPGSG